jgi:CTP:molybdopterin cytidylyltransferase MocA
VRLTSAQEAATLQTPITAIVLAGQRPGVDPLAGHFGIAYKALIPLCGETMLTLVVRTLNASPLIGEIIVLGQEPTVLADAVHAGGGGRILASNAGISTSLMALADGGTVAYPWLVTTADNPLLTLEMLAQFAAEATGDLAVAMVEKQNMLAAYPDAKRTWLRFADGDWSGANLFLLANAKVGPALALWSKAEKDRKQVWKLFWHFGPWLALLAITRQIGMGEALRRAGAKLKLSASLVAMADPVAAIDVDKLSDYQDAERILKGRLAA